jgi:predicted SnoaL-like aldol condensation-catalyzing enzyme
MSPRKNQVLELLKSFQTHDPAPLAFINPQKYIEHNLSVADGLAGLKARIETAPAGSLQVETLRIFEDGEFVFAQSIYRSGDCARVAFDIFRFEAGLIVEHWDNLQVQAPKASPSGHSMIDGPTNASELDKTEANKRVMQKYMDDLLAGRKETFPTFFAGVRYIQHNPWVGDDLTGLIAGLTALAKEGKAVKYDKVHRILGEGDFVLVVAEGHFGPALTSFYDLYRIDDGKLAEHWDTLEAIPPASEWKNANGKF